MVTLSNALHQGKEAGSGIETPVESRGKTKEHYVNDVIISVGLNV